MLEARAIILLFSIGILPSPSAAQSQTAYQAGLEAAQQRGAPDPQCFARVFARHAVVIERTSGRRSWFAPGTPSYNADMLRSCGFDRTQAAAATAAAPRTSAQGHSAPSAYRAGLRMADRNGYANRECFARVFARYAAPMQTPGGESGRWYSYNVQALMADARGACGL